MTHKQLEKELIHLIQTTDFEYGIVSETEKFVQKHIKSVKKILSKIFINCYYNYCITLGVIQIISRFEKHTFDNDVNIVYICLYDGEPEICECAIRTLEKWADIKSYDALIGFEEHINERNPNKDYLKEVIRDLQENLQQ